MLRRLFDVRARRHGLRCECCGRLGIDQPLRAGAAIDSPMKWWGQPPAANRDVSDMVGEARLVSLAVSGDLGASSFIERAGPSGSEAGARPAQSIAGYDFAPSTPADAAAERAWASPRIVEEKCCP